MDLRRELLTDAIPFPLKEEVVKAILEGKELKVAQVIELPHDFNTENINIINARQGGIFNVQFECFDTDESIFIKPKYKVGDVLWVEESAKITDYSFPSMDEILDGDARPKDWLMWYKLFDSEKDIEMVIPSRFIEDCVIQPQWIKEYKDVPSGCLKEIARILLKVTHASVKPLDDISVNEDTYLDIQGLNEKQDNPYLFVYEFEITKF